MTVGIYILCGCAMAVFFGATLDIENGDYKRTVGAIIACALWPISIAFGVGCGIGDACRAAASFLRGLRA
jgi:hypothetical protein